MHLPLRLAVFELSPSDAAASFTLNDIAARLLEQSKPFGIAEQEAAETALASRGYLCLEAYGADHYTVAGVSAFSVGVDFPRLVRASIDRRIRKQLTCLT